MLQVSLSELRVLRAVAQHGSFTVAATELGFTQSAVSKRIASLETVTGHQLVTRERRGVRLTAAGEVLLRHGGVALGALDDAERELAGESAARMRPVRLGAFASAAAGIVPGALERLSRERPEIAVTLREGSSTALARALRAGTLDLALLSDVSARRPPGDRELGLALEVLSEGPLRIAVSAQHRLAGRRAVRVAELAGERWVIARTEEHEQRLGVWPSVHGQPDAPYVVRDWLTKLRMVASGIAITTVSDVLLRALPADVLAIEVAGDLVERRRLLLARVAGTSKPEWETLATALRAVTASPIGAV